MALPAKINRGIANSDEEFKPRNVFCTMVSIGKPAEVKATIVAMAIARKMGTPKKERTTRSKNTIKPAFMRYASLLLNSAISASCFIITSIEVKIINTAPIGIHAYGTDIGIFKPAETFTAAA